MIKLDNISKYYYSSNAVVPALKKIQLEFNIGEFVAIIGESGSGKTTLLNIISGVDTYDDGELYYNGEPTSHFDAKDWEEYRKNKIGFVFANNNLIENYSALQNVESSLLIQGIEVHKARQTALNLLDKVGMSDFSGQKVAKLSSGQRQRLTIARALAKNTDIIIADEPTANLDSKTGKQIIELLSKISKHKLILLVTHNYEGVESFVTRKIRIQDGQVVLDIPVEQENPTETAMISISEPASEPTSEPTSETTSESDIIISTKKNIIPIKSSGSIARRFALMNLTSQRQKSTLLFTFMLLTAIVSFVFLGIIYSNQDDVRTRSYDKSIFYHEDMNRIAVRHPDGAEITKTDMKFFQSAAHVKIADMYDYANDINYYSDTDYKYTYSMSYDRHGDLAEARTLNFLNEDHFMKSASAIGEDDLRAGVLPTELYEIAVYSENADIIGTTIDYYFTAKNIWGATQHYFTTCKVTGILKEERDQIYFSEKLCSMFTVGLSKNTYLPLRYDYTVDEKRYKGSTAPIPIIGEGLEYNQIRSTQEFLTTTSLHPIGKAELSVLLHDDYGLTYKTTIYNMEIIPEANENNSSQFFEFSERFFYELFPQGSPQASLYIDDYAYIDGVLSVLKEQGYEAISTYSTSAIKYIPEKVKERMSTIYACILILLFLCIFEILIVVSFLCIKSKNFTLLKYMGMDFKTAKKITYYELPTYALAASVVVICTVIADKICGIGYFADLFKYFKIYSIIIYFAYNIFIAIITSFLFNRYLHRKMKKELI